MAVQVFFHPVLLSLSCVLVYHASDSAPSFLFWKFIIDELARLRPRVSFFYSVLSSLSCVLAYSASDSAPIFFFALPKKKTVAGGQKKKGALYGLSKGSIQPGLLAAAHACRASSKGLCAPPDAQPLTLAVCAAWQRHCRFHSVRLNGEKAENLLKRPAMLRRTIRDSAMPHLPNPTAQTSAAFVRWKGDAAA